MYADDNNGKIVNGSASWDNGGDNPWAWIPPRHVSSTEAREIFEKKKYNIDKGTDIDSVWAFQIIVKTDEEAGFHGLTPQECIDRKITLGYIELKT